MPVYLCVGVYRSLSGEGMISLHLVLGGFHGKRLDLRYGKEQDMLSDDGFRLWLDTHTMLREGGFHWAAPQCSSHVVLCRGPSGRVPPHYLGDTGKTWVRDGNAIMVRTALLHLMDVLLNVVGVIEQPLNSCLYKEPPLKTVLEFTEAMMQRAAIVD